MLIRILLMMLNTWDKYPNLQLMLLSMEFHMTWYSPVLFFHVESVYTYFSQEGVDEVNFDRFLISFSRVGKDGGYLQQFADKIHI